MLLPAAVRSRLSRPAFLESPRTFRTEVLAGLVVALALIPEAIAFSILAGVDPRVGLFASFTMAVTISICGGRPAMISAATGAIALIVAPLARDHGLEYLLAAVILGGVIQVALALVGVARLMRFIPRSVMVGFVNALAILIFASQVPHLIGVPWLVYPLVALALLIMVGLPRLTRAVPAPLVAIVVLTVITVFAHLAVPTVGDEGALPSSLPVLGIPGIPVNLETLQLIAPYAFGVALVGLMESLMTAKLVDDITDTHSNKTRESWAQGVANIVSGFFGGMGGCAMIGQTMINVKAAGARTRLSTFLSGVFLLVLVVVLGDIVAVIPMAALVAVMIIVAVSTFDWHSVAPSTLRRMPISETVVMVSTVAVVLATHNLAIGVIVGVLVAMVAFARRVAHMVEVTSVLDPDGRTRIYSVHGELFFASSNDLVYQFDYANDPQSVVIDMTHAHVWDASSVATLDAISTKYANRGKTVEIVELNRRSAQIHKTLAGNLRVGHSPTVNPAAGGPESRRSVRLDGTSDHGQYSDIWARYPLSCTHPSRSECPMEIVFRVLGEVEAESDGEPVTLGHHRQRGVLAVLLVEANRTVSVDQLVDRVWGVRVPQRARPTLYSYLSRLRRPLIRTPGEIERGPTGYRLRVPPAAVDLHRFRELVAQAAPGDQFEGGRGDCCELLDRALDLWRGEPFAGWDTPWFTDLRRRLEQERFTAELDRNTAALRRGRHARVVSGLIARHTEHPWDERLAGQLMLALYRCGRQADALACFDQLRRRLAAELGADPGPALRQLHRRILAADPSLAADPTLAADPPPATVPGRSRSAAAPGRAAPRQLPAPPATFTGRAAELAALTLALCAGPPVADPVSIAVVTGPGGMGKSWLALCWAHRHTAQFPDGQLYANLHGFDPAGEPSHPATVIRGFLDALGAPAVPADPDAQAAMYRSLTAGKRLLVLLDNARDTTQVAPLLPGAGGTAVLVTSRHTLVGLITAAGARPLTLDTLPDADARRLLVAQLGEDRLRTEPGEADVLVRHCAGLPLALGIVAARGTVRPEYPLSALAKELCQAGTRLDALDAGELAANLRTALACSVRALPTPAARAFGLLGLAPGPAIGIPAAASLFGAATSQTRALLRTLTDIHLVDEGPPGRFRMHDLVRLYAAEQSAGDAAAARRRILDHYLRSADDADRLLAPHRDPVSMPSSAPGVTVAPLGDHAAALAWFTAELPALVAAVLDAAGCGHERHAWLLAAALKNFTDHRGHWHDQVLVWQAALRAANRRAEPAAQAYAHRGLGLAYTWLRRFELAAAHLRQALACFAALSDLAGQAHAYRGLARLHAQQGEHAEALPYDQQAYALFRACGDRAGQANARNAVGWHRAHLGDYRRGLADCRAALARYRQLADPLGQATTWDSLGYIRLRIGEHRRAADCYRRAIMFSRQVGYRYFEGAALAGLGDALSAAGQRHAARRSRQAGLTILEQLGHRDADRLRRLLRAG